MNQLQHVETVDKKAVEKQARVQKFTYASLPHTIPLRTKRELKSMLLRHPAHKLRDVIDLFHEARKYTLGRIPIGDRETCIAILLSRDERNNGSPVKLESLPVVTGRKFR